MIPKAGNAKDVYAVDAMVSAIEARRAATKRLGLEVIIETAAGLAHVEEIAASSPRMQAMSIGPADYAAFMGMQTTAIGGTQANYYMLEDAREDGAERARHYADPWHYPCVAIVAACRTHGLLPVDGPFGDFSDPDGFRAQALRSASASRWNWCVKTATPSTGTSRLTTGRLSGTAISAPAAQIRVPWPPPQARRRLGPEPPHRDQLEILSAEQVAVDRPEHEGGERRHRDVDHERRQVRRHQHPEEPHRVGDLHPERQRLDRPSAG
jgi:hypothetical protein